MKHTKKNILARGIGEQKFCRLQSASSAHNMATHFKSFAQIQYWYDMNDIVVLSMHWCDNWIS